MVPESNLIEKSQTETSKTKGFLDPKSDVNSGNDNVASKDLLHIHPGTLSKTLLICNQPTKASLRTKQTYRMQKSSVLDRVKMFIPEIASANDKISVICDEEKEKLNIENIDDDGKVIEMNVTLVDNELIISDDDESSDESSNESEISDVNVHAHKKQVIQEIL